VVTTLVCFLSLAREAAGASCARLSLRPHFSRVRRFSGKPRARHAARRQTCIATSLRGSVGWAKRSVPTVHSSQEGGGHGASAPLPTLQGSPPLRGRRGEDTAQALGQWSRSVLFRTVIARSSCDEAIHSSLSVAEMDCLACARNDVEGAGACPRLLSPGGVEDGY
jgi:hypothetical protein